jgi:hypothetical protein
MDRIAAMNGKRELLRHAVAIVAYRAVRAIEGAPEGFGGFADCGRTPAKILAHMGDLFDWALSMAKGVAEVVIKAFEKSKLSVEGQAELFRESFAHASELGWFCRHKRRQ